MEEQPKELSKQKWHNLIYFLPFVWLILILITLQITNPIVVGPLGILVLFCLIYAFLNSLFFVALLLVGHTWQKVVRRPWLSKKKSYYLASVIALAPVFLIALNTLGQLGIIEVLLVGILVGLGGFYLLRLSR